MHTEGRAWYSKSPVVRVRARARARVRARVKVRVLEVAWCASRVGPVRGVHGRYMGERARYIIYGVVHTWCASRVGPGLAHVLCPPLVSVDAIDSEGRAVLAARLVRVRV